MYESKKKRCVNPTEVRFCRLCGAEIVQLRFANGQPYYANVITERGNRLVILGEGNNYNFKPQHNCAREAEHILASAEHDYANFVREYETAEANIKAHATNDEALAKAGINDEALLAVFDRLKVQANAALIVLLARKPSQDQYIQTLRQRVDLLKGGQPCIPEGQPAIGRKVRVVKGRSAPRNATGTITWMGVDNFTNGIRIGFETETGRYFTSADNLEIVNT